jgi:ribosomal protein S18 acetylase RimI-like enzyme
VSLPEHVSRFWRAVDDAFQRVDPTWWGAVVTDARYPGIHDVNYGRIDVPSSDLSLEEVAREVTPALERAGVGTLHLVCFDPVADVGLLPEVIALGHRSTWDAVMDHATGGSAAGLGGLTMAAVELDVVELDPTPELWARVGASLGHFGVDDVEHRGQLLRIEQDVLTRAGKRWFGVADGGMVVAMGALLVLEGVGYVDNVLTFPEARGRGFATAITARIVREARVAGAEHVVLFADPDDPAVIRLYERLGFREVGRLASTKGPVSSLA